MSGSSFKRPFKARRTQNRGIARCEWQPLKDLTIKFRDERSGLVDTMAMHRFDLITEWHLDDPIESVRQVLMAIENWPLWWCAVKRLEALEPFDANGLGLSTG